jgi:hypothetical protein
VKSINKIFCKGPTQKVPIVNSRQKKNDFDLNRYIYQNISSEFGKLLPLTLVFISSEESYETVTLKPQNLSGH